MTDKAAVLGAWEKFCDDVKAVGLERVAQNPSATPEEASEVLHFVARTMRWALDWRLDGVDTHHPRLSWWDRATAAAAPIAPNIDNSYLIATIDPAQTYRLRIESGTIDDVNISLHKSMLRANGVLASGDLTCADLKERDGWYELTFGPEEGEAAHLRTSSDVDYIFIRLYYFDWPNTRPPAVTIECIGQGAAPAIMPAGDFVKGIGEAAAYVRFGIVAGDHWIAGFTGKSAPNIFSPPAGESLSSEYLQFGGTRFELGPGEALVMEFEEPDAPYWVVQWHHLPFGDAADIRNVISSINNQQVSVDADGKVRIVFSADDPGIPNWIGTEGRGEGLVAYRWRHSKTAPVPVSHVVAVDRVADFLHPETPRVDESHRAAQISMRRDHLSLRY